MLSEIILMFFYSSYFLYVSWLIMQQSIWTRMMIVQFNCSFLSDTLRPHGLQHTGTPCPSPTPRACSNSCPLSPWCHPAISSFVVHFPSCLQSFLASHFSNESVFHIRWPKYWSFIFSISPCNEYSGLISFWIDYFDLAIQETLKSLLQHHITIAALFWCSAFFMVQISHPYMTTGKTIALTIPLLAK